MTGRNGNGTGRWGTPHDILCFAVGVGVIVYQMRWAQPSDTQLAMWLAFAVVAMGVPLGRAGVEWLLTLFLPRNGRRNDR